MKALVLAALTLLASPVQAGLFRAEGQYVGPPYQSIAPNADGYMKPPSMSIEKEPLPEIIGTPFLREHEGKMYMCGMAVHNPNSTHREKGRFVMLFEPGTDWKIYEPSVSEVGEDVWEAWDTTYLELCEAD